LLFGTFSALFFELDSNAQFWLQFIINLAVTNDFIVVGIVEN